MIVDGRYAIVLDAETARQRATLELKTQGAKLSGKISGVMGAIEFTGGTVDGVNLKWKMHGQVSAIYKHTHDWEVTARVEGDTITGLAKIEILGDTPFTGTRQSGDPKTATIPWVDLGLPRYEAISVEWVKALDDYVRQKTKGKATNINVSWSTTYTNPPSHLLRGDGRNTIGFTLRVADGELRAFDGPTAGSDVETTYPYDPSALLLRLNTDRYAAWVAEHGASIQDKISMKVDKEAIRMINQLLAGTGNDIREEFWSQHTK